MWQVGRPQFFRDNLVSSSNPNVTITNSELELAGGFSTSSAPWKPLTPKNAQSLSKETTSTLLSGGEKTVLRWTLPLHISFLCLAFIKVFTDMYHVLIILQALPTLSLTLCPGIFIYKYQKLPLALHTFSQRLLVIKSRHLHPHSFLP